MIRNLKVSLRPLVPSEPACRDVELTNNGGDSRGFRRAGRRHLSGRKGALQGLIALAALFGNGPVFAQTNAGHANPDWPCRQIMVGHLSVAAVWSGPPIEGINWQSDQAIADLVAKLAPRRTSLEEAERAIEEFAHAQGAGKSKRLTVLFAGLFETLDNERAQVIEGLLRLGAKQKELAEKIRNENMLPQQGHGGEPPDASAKPGRGELEWDLRIFDERRQSLTYVCETPTLIEQRLFALAKTIQHNME